MAHCTVLVDGSAGAYGVSIPDLPGCTAMGATVEEALQNAVAALRDWIEVTEESGEAVPPPRPFEDVRADAHVAEAIMSGATLASLPLVRESGPRRL